MPVFQANRRVIAERFPVKNQSEHGASRGLLLYLCLGQRVHNLCIDLDSPSTKNEVILRLSMVSEYGLNQSLKLKLIN